MKPKIKVQIFLFFLISYFQIENTFAQKINIKNDMITINEKEVGKIQTHYQLDSTRFMDNQGNLKLVFYKRKVFLSADRSITNTDFYEIFYNPTTGESFEGYSRQKRVFKPNLGLTEKLVEWGLLSENGFDDAAIAAFFETKGLKIKTKEDTIRIDKLKKLEASQPSAAQIAQMERMNEKFESFSYRADKINNATFSVQNGNKIYKQDALGSRVIGIFSWILNSDQNYEIEVRNENKQVIIAKGLCNPQDLGMTNTTFQTNSGYTFKMKMNYSNQFQNDIVRLAEELVVRDADFELKTDKALSITPKTNDDIAREFLGNYDKLLNEAIESQFIFSKIYLTDSSIIETKARIATNKLPEIKGIESMGNTVGEGTKVYIKELKDNGKEKTKAIDAEEIRFLVREKDTFYPVPFKPSAASNGSLSLGKLMAKVKPRMAKKVYQNEEVSVYDFDNGVPVVWIKGEEEAMPGNGMGVVAKLKEKFPKCPNAFTHLDNNNYQWLLNAYIEWAKKLGECGK
ncbi:MAG: hypothetical protein MUE53_04855 [Chitinophagales bacterium]|jgi:hypothetical protein|nr:hypothetical protein [Chitinophagales bacterium]